MLAILVGAFAVAVVLAILYGIGSLMSEPSDDAGDVFFLGFVAVVIVGGMGVVTYGIGRVLLSLVEVGR